VRPKCELKPFYKVTTILLIEFEAITSNSNVMPLQTFSFLFPSLTLKYFFGKKLYSFDLISTSKQGVNILFIYHLCDIRIEFCILHHRKSKLWNPMLRISFCISQFEIFNKYQKWYLNLIFEFFEYMPNTSSVQISS
jgi:hypothetical protein